MTGTGSFKFRYGAFRPLLSALGMGPGFSRVELDGDTLRVRMGWAFRAAIPVDHDHRRSSPARAVGGIGVHGWRGRWLVNGATTGLLAITVDPAGAGLGHGHSRPAPTAHAQPRRPRRPGRPPSGR